MSNQPTNTNGGYTKPRTKSEIFKAVSEKTGLTRKQVAAVFDTMGTLIKKDLDRWQNVIKTAGIKAE